MSSNFYLWIALTPIYGFTLLITFAIALANYHFLIRQLLAPRKRHSCSQHTKIFCNLTLCLIGIHHPYMYTHNLHQIKIIKVINQILASKAKKMPHSSTCYLLY